MKHAFKTIIGAVTIASMTFAVTSAHAAASKEEQKCHATIAKNITKYQSALVKNLTGCHSGRVAGKIGNSVNCNITAQADTKGKTGATRAKAKAAIQGACDGLAPATIALYTACPSPNAGAITNGSTLADCLLNLSESYVNKIGEELFGLPMMPLATPQEATCISTTGKALAKYAKAVGGARSKCQAGVEKAGGSQDLTTTCSVTDTSGKIAPALAALISAVNTNCALGARSNWVNAGNCASREASPTAADLVACGITKVAKPVTEGLASASLELPGTCAASAEVVINAANGEKITNTRLDSGWTGLAHGVDVGDQSVGAVKLENCDSNCRNCEVKMDASAGNCRCENNPQTECTTIEGADGACGGGTCHCMFGPPLALNSSGTPVCVVNRFSQDFEGSTQEVGEYDVLTETRALVHLGISQLQPCPTCDGDTTMNDGNRQGHCNGGTADGALCDANAGSADWGATSFDCPPDPLTNVSGSGLLLNLSFNSGTSSLTAGISNASYCGAGTCHCSVCANDVTNTIGCQVDQDCVDAGVGGTCGKNFGSANPKENKCTAVSDCNGGLCDNDFDYFCTGAVRTDGGGILTCTTNADCTALNTSCEGNDCGTCELITQRQCFSDTITATGTPGIFNSEGVSTFCSGMTSNSGVNSAGGLPGPGRVKLDFDFNLKCSDGTTQFNLPEGSNCP